MTTEAIENPNPRKIPKTIERIGWESLPYDLLVRIYEKLPIEELVVGAPVVCRQWYAASLDASLYKVLDLRNWRRIFGWVASRAELGDFLSIVVPRGNGEVERVMFPHLVGDSDLVFVADRCPNIKFLFLRSRGLGLISEEAIFHAISKWKDLESMDVDESCLTSKILSAIHSSCEGFVSLTTVSGRLTKDTTLDIARCLPKLKSINLSNTVLSNDTLLTILKGCKELKSINLSNTALSNDTLLAILKGCKELESLDITGCGQLALGPEQVRKYTAGLKSFKFDGGLFHDIFEDEELEIMDQVDLIWIEDYD